MKHLWIEKQARVVERGENEWHAAQFYDAYGGGVSQKKIVRCLESFSCRRAFQLSKLIPKRMIERESQDKRILVTALIKQFKSLLKTPKSVIDEMNLLKEIDH